jgi:secreted trypsin-like serine protease
MKRFTILAASLVVLSTLGVARRAAAVTGGTPLEDATADGVVMILIDDGSSLCSGALIAPTVVLTAAHCLSNPTVSTYSVRGGLDPLQDALFTIGASEVHQHPSYDSIDASHDVGVLILASAAPATPLPWLPTNEGYYTFGTQVGVVGYGVTGPSATDEGIRRSGVAAISEVSAGVFLTDYTSGQGICFGDAGGPAITTDEINPGVVIGVSSIGDQFCAEYSGFQRTDANADFIGLYAPEPSALASVEIAFGALFVLARRRG